ncbi:MAG: ferredoxin [Nanoarchaeota archaeon]
MAKLRIEYYKGRCIGQGNCAALDPEHFELLGKKARLLNSRNIGKKTYALEVSCDGKAADRIIDAGRSCPVNAIRVTDIEKNKDIVSVKVEENDVREIVAEYDDKEFVIDDKGYFLIRVDWEKENIEVAFCKEKNKVALKIIGKKPIDIYHTIINKEKLPIRKDQSAYLGRELQKAYIALKNSLEYVQDEELDLNKKASR